MLQWIARLLGWKNKEPEDNSMKYLIVGLGNMESQYDDTRHNIGFDVVDVMAEESGSPWKLSTLGAIAEVKHKGRKLILLKPSTYMNRSGKAVKYWMEKEKIPVDRIMVVVDDLNLGFGLLRMRAKGSDGGHNGLKDIQEKLGNSKYPRLRFGIGDNFNKGRQVDFVLGKWGEEERTQLPEMIAKAVDAIKAFTTIGLGRAMSQYNG